MADTGTGGVSTLSFLNKYLDLATSGKLEKLPPDIRGNLTTALDAVSAIAKKEALEAGVLVTGSPAAGITDSRRASGTGVPAKKKRDERSPQPLDSDSEEEIRSPQRKKVRASLEKEPASYKGDVLYFREMVQGTSKLSAAQKQKIDQKSALQQLRTATRAFLKKTYPAIDTDTFFRYHQGTKDVLTVPQKDESAYVAFLKSRDGVPRLFQVAAESAGSNSGDNDDLASSDEDIAAHRKSGRPKSVRNVASSDNEDGESSITLLQRHLKSLNWRTKQDKTSALFKVDYSNNRSVADTIVRRSKQWNVEERGASGAKIREKDQNAFFAFARTEFPELFEGAVDGRPQNAGGSSRASPEAPVRSPQKQSDSRKVLNILDAFYSTLGTEVSAKERERLLSISSMKDKSTGMKAVHRCRIWNDEQGRKGECFVPEDEEEAFLVWLKKKLPVVFPGEAPEDGSDDSEEEENVRDSGRTLKPTGSKGGALDSDSEDSLGSDDGSDAERPGAPRVRRRTVQPRLLESDEDGSENREDSGWQESGSKNRSYAQDEYVEVKREL